MRKKTNKELLDTMHKNPGNWKGVFYFNKKDHRLTVPKINSLGWTFNFANPLSYILILAVLLIIFGMQFLIQ